MSVPLIQAAEVALGRQRAPKYETGDHIVQYLRSANIGDGFLDLSDVKSMDFSPSEQATFSLRAGDVLVTEGSGSRDTVGSSAVWHEELPKPICFQNTVLRVRPRLGTSDGRYLAWWTRHAHASGLIAAVATGANILHLGAENLRRLPIDLPSLVEQQRIADFLDDQVSRIDQVVSLRRSESSGLDDRIESMFEQALSRHGFHFPRSLDPDWAIIPRPSGWQIFRLSQGLSQLTNGFVGPTRDILVDDGIPYVQSTHIKGGLIDFQRRPFYVTREWHRQRPRIHLREGDVLIVQTGDIGQVAVVPKEFGEASCHALQIARVKADVISGDYLGGYLRTAFGKHSLLCRATGALHPHLEGSIRSVPIVVPPASVQAEVVHEVEGAHATLVSLQGHVHRQIELLGERKRALITSAVTGEFDLTTASGRGVA